jgi:hypothetical protein
MWSGVRVQLKIYYMQLQPVCRVRVHVVRARRQTERGAGKNNRRTPRARAFTKSQIPPTNPPTIFSLFFFSSFFGAFLGNESQKTPQEYISNKSMSKNFFQQTFLEGKSMSFSPRFFFITTTKNLFTKKSCRKVFTK